VCVHMMRAHPCMHACIEFKISRTAGVRLNQTPHK